MTRQHPLDNRVPPPVLGIAAALVQRRLPRVSPSPRRRVAGGAVALVSAIVAGASSHLFQRSGTTVNPLAPEMASALVTDGAFGLTRNPMYVGMAGILLAHAILRGHPSQLLPVVGWVAYIDRFQVRPEERALSAVFGSAYDDYKQHVHRWL